MRLLAAARLSASGPALDPLGPRRLFFGGLAIGVVAMSVVGLATTVFIESPHDVAALSAAPASTPITAVARWQVLRHAITVQGIVRSRRPIFLTAMAPFSTVTLTRMPEKAGDRVRPGHLIAEIDGRPVILLRGRLPAYRNLHEGDHGPDVSQLQRNLVHFGYADFDPRGYFGDSTALALLLFYRHLGYVAPIYHRRVTRPPATREPAAPHSAAHGIAARRTTSVFVIPSAYLPRSEVVFIPSASALVTAVGARVGDLVGGAAVLTLATGSPYVTADLTAHQAAEARLGMPATIVAASPRLTARGSGDQDRLAATRRRTAATRLPGPGQAGTRPAAAHDWCQRPPDAAGPGDQRAGPDRACRGHRVERAWQRRSCRRAQGRPAGHSRGRHRANR